MPTLGKTKVSPSLISTGSLFLGTSSYAVTASYAMNGGSGGSGGSTQTGSIANQTVLYNVTTSQDNTITGLNLSSNKWGVTVVEEWNSGSIVGDEYYNSCSLLLHFSGSNGSTTFIDNSPSPKTATSNNGAAISTAQSKFGGTSGFFDGTNDYLSIPNNAAFNFASGTFTVELWAYFSSVPGDRTLVSTYQNSTTGWYINLASSNIIVGFTGDGAEIYGTATISANTWYHIAVSGTAGSYKLFINGIQDGSTYTGGTALTSTAPLYLGVLVASGTGYYYLNGYIDELRITNGVARYTGSFVTQSAAFPDNLNVTQYATKYIGLVGGLNDSNVDYGVEKLNDSSLKIRKMTASGQPLSGSGALSASVDRVYVNVLDYTNVMVTSSYALTASYVLGGIQTGSISNQTILYNVTTSQDNTITGLDLSGNKWDVSVIEEWNSASIVGDQYYSSCSLLLHCDGINGSTTFTDNSPNNLTVTSYNGAAISTVQSKFGGASLLLDGTNDYLSTTHRTNFNVGASDFTIEAWVYTGTISQQVIFGANRDYDGVGACMFNLNYTGKVRFFCSYAGGSFLDYNVGAGTISDSVWHHVAVTRNGSSLRIFIDGIQTGTTNTTLGTAAIDNAIADYRVGSSTDGYLYFNGYIDDLRVTKGVARYTGSFSVPTSEFPTTITQLQTKYVGLVGGINDSTVDYGVEKLSDGSLKIRKMSATGQPLSGSGALSASVDRVYVNVLNYKEVQTTAQSASYAVSASYLINAASGESFHPFLLG